MRKPIKPIKPIEPKKKIEKKSITNISTLYGDGETYLLYDENKNEVIVTLHEDHYYSSGSSGSYNDNSSRVSIDFANPVVEIFDNPYYEKEMEYYNSELKKYEKNMAKYNKNMIKYDIFKSKQSERLAQRNKIKEEKIRKEELAQLASLKRKYEKAP